MIRKVLEALFRFKLLLVVPPIVIPAIVTPIAVVASPPLFDTSTSVWVDRPAYLNYRDSSIGFGTGVQTQAARLNELLHTRAFLVDVAQRTSLAPLAGSPTGQARISDLVTRGVSIGGGSAGAEHLLVVHVQTITAQLSFELCKAIVDAYQDKMAADQADQADIAVQFYQSRLQQNQTSLDQANQALRRYIQAYQTTHGDAGQLNDQTQPILPSTLLDPKLGVLETSVQTAQADYNSAQSSLTQAQQDASASVQGQQLGFQVLDPPQLATAPTPQLKKIIVYPIAAMLAGLALSGTMLVYLVASDRSARSESDLAPGSRVLGILPTVKLKKMPKHLRGVATRRAIGAVAGTALPAPSGAK